MRLAKLPYFSLFLVILASMAGCNHVTSEEDSDSLTGPGCQVEADQQGSFLAKAKGFPLTLEVDASFTAEQKRDVEAAAARWNDLGRILRQGDFFRLRLTEFSQTFRGMNFPNCENSFGGEEQVSLVNNDSGERWGRLGLRKNTPAATMRCFRKNKVRQQVVLVYTPIVEAEQFQSVILHELGHVLGLDHSCTLENGSENFLACRGLSRGHAYREAIMYPELHNGASRGPRGLEIKEQLQSNDILRTHCLYW